MTKLYKSQIETGKIESKKVGKKDAKAEISEMTETLAAQSVTGCLEMMLHTVVF